MEVLSFVGVGDSTMGLCKSLFPAKLLPLLQSKQLQSPHGHQAALQCFPLGCLIGTVQVPDVKSIGNSLPQATSGHLALLVEHLAASDQLRVCHLITTPKLMTLNMVSALPLI